MKFKLSLKLLLNVGLLILIIIPLVTNIFSCSNINNNEILNNIVNPKHGWPPVNEQQKNNWKKIYNNAINAELKCNNELVNDYQKFYLQEFDKNKSSNVPASDLAAFDKKMENSFLIQKFFAYVIVVYYAEYWCNYLYGNPGISSDEYLLLWTMNYFNAGFYFQWLKLWYAPQEKIIESQINFDFYTYSAYVQTVPKTGEANYSKPPLDNKVIPQIKLNSILNNLVSKTYNLVFKKES